MALHPANNTDPCGGVDNELNGCMVVFPRMEPGGTLCMRCTKLHKSELSEDDRARILSVRAILPLNHICADDMLQIIVHSMRRMRRLRLHHH